jgi:hypothetical protein
LYYTMGQIKIIFERKKNTQVLRKCF